VDCEAFFAAKYLIRREAADGGVEELDHVEGGHGLFAAAAEGAHDLQQAAGVGGDYGLRLGGEQVADLAVAELLGGLGLEEVVDAGGAAAEGGFGDLGDFELGDSGEELAGLLVDSLGVTEKAAVGPVWKSGRPELPILLSAGATRERVKLRSPFEKSHGWDLTNNHAVFMSKPGVTAIA